MFVCMPMDEACDRAQVHPLAPDASPSWAGCVCASQELGAPSSVVKDGIPSPTFNGGHPDPNLTYAHELVRSPTGFGAMSGQHVLSPGFVCFAQGPGEVLRTNEDGW